MPGIELLSTPLDPTLDRLSSKIQEIRDRKNTTTDTTVDNAIDMVGQNLGRKEAREADLSMQGLSMDLIQQGASAHSLDPAIVADLIADPFED